MSKFVCVFLLLGVMVPQVGLAAALTPGDILLTTNRFYASNTVYEYKPSGTFVQSWNVPFPGLDPTAGQLRGVAVSPDRGTIYTYDGNSPAYLSTISPATNTFGQQQATNMGTGNDLTSGSVAVVGNYLFVAPVDGHIARFNPTNFSYQTFITNESIGKISIGGDGLLYALNGDELAGWPGVEVYDPNTMNLIRSFAFVGSGSSGVCGGPDSSIYSIGGTTLYHYSEGGTLLNSLTTPYGLTDIQISPSGKILLGSQGAWILTDTSLTLANTQYFATPNSAPVFVSFVPSAVPEPTTLAIVLAGIPLLLKRRRG